MENKCLNHFTSLQVSGVIHNTSFAVKYAVPSVNGLSFFLSISSYFFIVSRLRPKLS